MDPSPFALPSSDQSARASSGAVDSVSNPTVDQKARHSEEIRVPAEKANALPSRSDQANPAGKSPSVPTYNKSTQAGKSSTTTTKKSVQWVRVSRENHTSSTSSSSSLSSSSQQESSSSSSSSSHQQCSGSGTAKPMTEEDTVRVCDNHGLKGADASLPLSCNQVVADAIVQENKQSLILCDSKPKECEASRSDEALLERPFLEENPQKIESHNSTNVHCQTNIVEQVEDEEERMENENIPVLLVSEEIQSSGQPQPLSRSSSLNAKAREFIPGEFTSKNPKVSSNTSVMIPLGSSPGILSAFPSATQMANFPIQMPLLGSPHIGLMSVQIPPMPPPQAMIIHPTTSNVVLMHPHAHPHNQLGSLLDSGVNQPSSTIAADIEDHGQDEVQQEPDMIASATPVVAASKPVLTEELRAKIVKQVEFYFSDANLPTDHHLMKFVKKDPDGFVPISIVANFRKIRNLMKNHSLVSLALRTSKELVVSEDGKKVRRLNPLPPIDMEEIQSRTVVAENLPDDHSIESMEKLFGSVGNVKMVRVCEPEAENGANQTANKFKSDLVVSNKLHAVVEYESVEQAERAVSMLTDQRNWRSGLHVRLLLRRTFQNKHVHQTSGGSKASKAVEGGDASGGEEETNHMNESHLEKSMEDSYTDEQIGNDSTQEGLSKRDKRKGRGGGRGRGRGNLFHHPNSNGGRSQIVGTPPQSSAFTAAEMKPPPGPRMPDGTRGFSLGRGKVLTN